MKFEYNDGGRAAAGYRGATRDCVTRSIAIAAEVPYADVYDSLNALSGSERTPRGGKRSSSRTGVRRAVYEPYLAALGFVWTPTMSIGSGCKVHLRAEELPAGRLVVAASRHLVAVIDGVIHDISDCTRGGSRCVYGYYSKEVE